jgi:hypothetical protein
MASNFQTKPIAEAAWRTFPELEKLSDLKHYQAMMGRIEATCRLLDETRQSGTPRERERAAAALVGYGRTLELIQLIQERIAASETSSPGGR